MPSGGNRRFGQTQHTSETLHRVRDPKVFTKLPRRCSRPVPEWPLSVPKPSVAELEYWNTLWHLPQAHVWHEDLKDGSVIALYVRQFIEAAQPRASAQLRINVRQAAGELLLSPGSLMAARYVIVDSAEDEILKKVEQEQALAASTGTDDPRPGPQRSSARDRMNVVEFKGRDED